MQVQTRPTSVLLVIIAALLAAHLAVRLSSQAHAQPRAAHAPAQPELMPMAVDVPRGLAFRTRADGVVEFRRLRTIPAGNIFWVDAKWREIEDCH